MTEDTPQLDPLFRTAAFERGDGRVTARFGLTLDNHVDEVWAALAAILHRRDVTDSGALVLYLMKAANGDQMATSGTITASRAALVQQAKMILELMEDPQPLTLTVIEGGREATLTDGTIPTFSMGSAIDDLICIMQ